MKKGLLFAAFITAFAVGGFAQQGKPKDRLAELQLTTQQKTSVDSIRAIYDGQRKALKKDATLNEEAKAEKLKTIRKEQNTAINHLLSKEQKQQLKKDAKEGNKKED